MFKPNRARRTVRLALTLALLGAATAGDLGAQPAVSVREGPIASPVQRRMKAYRMSTGFRGPDHARGLASRLFARSGGEQAVELRDDRAGGLIHVAQGDPSAHFRIDTRTGDFSFNRGMQRYHGGDATPGLPDSARAVAAALAHLRELGELPDGDELVVRHVGGMRMSEIENGQTRTVDKLVTVHFGRRLDGVDVGGPGSKIVVHLGENAGLVGLQKRWTALREEPRGPADFRAPDEVRAAVTGHMRSEWARARRVDAGTPELGYYDDGRGNIEPAYFFVSTLAYDGEDARRPGHADRYLGVVPALKASRADFQQEERARVQPQVARNAPPGGR